MNNNDILTVYNEIRESILKEIDKLNHEALAIDAVLCKLKTKLIDIDLQLSMIKQIKL